MPITRLDQIASTDWQMKIGELGAVVEGAADVDQSIRIILTTPKGSVPHRPDFGSDLALYVDWPLREARPHVIRETVDAIARWEPRVEITRVEVETDGAAGALLVRIERRLRSIPESAAETVVRIAA